MGSIDRIIKKITKLPNWMNRIILHLNVFGGIIYGNEYRKKKKQIGIDLKKTQQFPNLMNQFVLSTPFYAERYTEVQSFSEFENKIGYIDKSVVLTNFNDFFSSYYQPNKYVEGTTGGTTGKPMRIIVPNKRYGFELAVVHSFWHKFGWNFHPRAVIRNHKLNNGEIYKINPITKEIIFDAFRIDGNYIRQIHGVLKKLNIRYVQAYPSSAYQFCKFCSDLNLDISFIKAFFTSSEPLHTFQTEFIENQLKIPLFNFYGHSEKLIIADRCANSGYFHFEPSYGLAELIDEQGRPITTQGYVGELVGTTYNNPGMPLIRYKTGDFAEYVGTMCPNCNKNGLIVTNIVGHYNSNLIYKTEDAYTTTTALNLHSNLYNTIDGIQYYQDTIGQLIVRIKPNNLYTEKIERELIIHFENALGKECKVKLEQVNSFEKSANGKYQLLINKLNNGK